MITKGHLVFILVLAFSDVRICFCSTRICGENYELGYADESKVFVVAGDPILNNNLFFIFYLFIF